jgi:hypothetical protein
MHSSQLRIVLQHLTCYLRSHSVLSCPCLLLWSNWSVPVWSLLCFFLCRFNSLRVALLRHSRLTSMLWNLGSCILLLLWLSCSLVPLFCHLFFPIRLLLDFLDTVFDNSQRLSNFKVLHVGFVV